MNNIELGKISKYRGELMGFAIIIVMLFHVALSIKSPWYGLRRMGNLGVDIFFFLSGIGLWYSWAKNQCLRHFYFNRAIRIYPAWLIIAGYFYISRFHLGAPSYSLPFGGTGNGTADSIIDLVGDILFNWDFWLHDELTFWYVPATMMLYLFAPFYMEMLRRNRIFQWLVVLPLMWCIMVTYITPLHHALGHIEIFWSRVPIFFLGINCAEAVKQKQTIDKQAWGMVGMFFIISLGACIWLEQFRHGRFPLYTERMLYIVLAVTTIIIMAEIFSLLEGWSKRKGICERLTLGYIFSWIGGISLEIYLVHVEFIMYPLEKTYHLGYWSAFFLTLVISLPVAWVISKVSKYIIKKVK